MVYIVTSASISRYMEHISHPCDSPLSCLVHLHGRISVHDCNSSSEQMSGAKDGQGEHAALLALVPQLWVGTIILSLIVGNHLHPATVV